MVMDDLAIIEEVVDSLLPPGVQKVYRVHGFDRTSLLSGGSQFPLKDLFGVDFIAEASLFSQLDYLQGQYSTDWDPNTLVLSAPAAELLKVRFGDSLVLRVENRQGQTDTRELVVRAILRDDSVFGYSRAYIDHTTAAQLLGLSPASYSVLGLVLPDPLTSRLWATTIRQALENRLPLGGPIETRNQLTTELRKSWQGVQYFVFDLPVYLGEITDLLGALRLGSYLLLGIMNLVVLAAALVTYRVVLHQRTRELGTLVALGYPHIFVVALLFFELLMLLGLGILFGTLLGLGATQVTGLFAFEWIPGFELFLTNGRLVPLFLSSRFFANSGIMVLAVIPPVLFMALRMVHRPIPNLLKGQLTAL